MDLVRILDLTDFEKDLYGEYFQRLVIPQEEATTSPTPAASQQPNLRIPGVFAAEFLLKSNLPITILQQIWLLSDNLGRGYLTAREFYTALRLIAHAQDKKTITTSLISTPAPLPTFSASELNLSKSPIACFARLGQISSFAPSVFAHQECLKLSPQEIACFRKIFTSVTNNNAISGSVVRSIFLESGLKPANLSEIWNLCDRSCKGYLHENEFILAMHLVIFKYSGENLPSVVPDSFFHSVNETMEPRYNEIFPTIWISPFLIFRDYCNNVDKLSSSSVDSPSPESSIKRTNSNASDFSLLRSKSDIVIQKKATPPLERNERHSVSLLTMSVNGKILNDTDGGSARDSPPLMAGNLQRLASAPIKIRASANGNSNNSGGAESSQYHRRAQSVDSTNLMRNIDELQNSSISPNLSGTPPPIPPRPARSSFSESIKGFHSALLEEESRYELKKSTSYQDALNGAGRRKSKKKSSSTKGILRAQKEFYESIPFTAEGWNMLIKELIGLRIDLNNLQDQLNEEQQTRLQLQQQLEKLQGRPTSASPPPPLPPPPTPSIPAAPISSTSPPASTS